MPDYSAIKRGVEQENGCSFCGAKIGDPCVVTPTHRTKPENLGRPTAWPHSARQWPRQPFRDPRWTPLKGVNLDA